MDRGEVVGAGSRPIGAGSPRAWRETRPIGRKRAWIGDGSRMATMRLPSPDPVFPILRSPHPPVLAHHHRCDRFAPLDGRDVETLDAPRNRGKLEHRLQRLERVVLRGGRLVEPRLVRQGGVAVREVDEAPLLAALWHDDADAKAGALREPRFERLALVRLR